jgi:hypothetical protein
MTSTVMRDNLVTIPPALVERYHIQPGTVLDWSEEGEERLSVRVIPSRKALAEKLCGAGAHLQPERDLCQELAQEREEEVTVGRGVL